MRIGIQMVIQNHKDYSDREMYKHELRLAIEAEGWGYDILWPVEHHFFDYSICPDNMQYLSYVAARTERIELATGAYSPGVCGAVRGCSWASPASSSRM